ncbi:MAG: cyclohexanecarboxylate-CoA ligase, partial [Bryobacterales bacterium]|nr:cyclohexanecarboxylate-CoA ligase [Bryobacterales bacterium]
MVTSLAIPLSKPVDPASIVALGAVDFRVEDNVLYLTMPWADVWSWRLLVRQLEQPSPVPSYREFARRQEHWLKTGLLEAQRTYWERKLAGVPDFQPASRIEKFPFAVPAPDRNELLTAFVSLLACYSGETDICIGISAANRIRPGSAGIIGPLANMLGIRVDASSPDLAGEVSRTLLDALRNQDLPQSRTFAAMFLPETVEGATWLTPRSNADLTLTAEGFEYNPDRYTRETVSRMAEHFRNLLATGEMLSTVERDQFALWNRTSAPYRQMPVAELIEPSEAIAVEYGNRSLTYVELLARAARVANLLRASGVGRDVVVGALLDRSEDLPAAILGIWKAGGAYLPLDPSFPAERLAFMLQDSGASVLLTERRLAGQLTAPNVILVEDAHTGELPEPAFSPASLGNLAAILYTSGSTGRPKGAAITHRNLVNLIEAMIAETGFTPTDVLLAITTISFDAAAMELFLPLVAGGRVVIASREDAQDGRRLARLIGRHEPTLMFATPATWRSLVQTGWEGNPRLGILSGGEVLTPELAASLLTRARAVWNGYGPTETTVFSAVYRVQPGEAKIPIGRPIANTQFQVLDPQQRPVPIGLAGELWISGDGVGRGYPNGQFRSGDRVRYLPTGDLEFLGRTDNMAKVRGNRVEPGEVESALLDYAGVRAAAVVPESDSLTAYIVSDAPAEPLRAHLASRLPAFMVPSRVVYLESMPLTGTGKIDRLALPKCLALEPPSSRKL